MSKQLGTPETVDLDLRLTSRLEITPDPQYYNMPECAFYAAALYVGPHRIKCWPFYPSIPLTSREVAKLVNDVVAAKVRALFTASAEEHFGPRAGWTVALQSLREMGEAAAGQVTTHPTDLAQIEKIERDAATALERDQRPPQPAAPSKPEQRCALYRHYDPDGTLLYIGITSWQGDRDGGHVRTSTWVLFADRVAAQWFPSRELALAAERLAIQSEAPVFNKRHAPPGRNQRVLAYLVARRRLDLLPKLT